MSNDPLRFVLRVIRSRCSVYGFRTETDESRLLGILQPAKKLTLISPFLQFRGGLAAVLIRAHETRRKDERDSVQGEGQELGGRLSLR
jgi:hypothetical protein